MIRIVDTGEDGDEADEIDVYGVNGTPQGNLPGTTVPYEADDIFLLVPAGCSLRGANGPAACTPSPGVLASVALLHGTAAPFVGSNASCAGGNDYRCYRDAISGNEPSTAIQQILLALEAFGSVTVHGAAGNDVFLLGTPVLGAVIDGGSGIDSTRFL